MTIGELIEQLEEMKEQVGGDTEIRYALQPSWPFEFKKLRPFEYSIRNAYALNKDERRNMAEALLREEGMNENDIRKHIDEDELEQAEDVVYLEEGSQLGYLPDEAKQLLGW